MAENILATFNDETVEPMKVINTNGNFLLNEQVLTKTDFIRLLNVLSELRAFKYENGTVPHKKDVMSVFGKLVGLDLESFHPDLNKGLEKSVEANTKIFEALKSKAEDLWNKKNN